MSHPRHPSLFLSLPIVIIHGLLEEFSLSLSLYHSLVLDDYNFGYLFIYRLGDLSGGFGNILDNGLVVVWVVVEAELLMSKVGWVRNMIVWAN